MLKLITEMLVPAALWLAGGCGGVELDAAVGATEATSPTTSPSASPSQRRDPRDCDMAISWSRW
jgi:hypothetical protein